MSGGTREYFLGYTPRRFFWGQATVGRAARVLGRLRVYGLENVPMEGGLVVAMNHFSWFDPGGFGAAFPRRMYFLAKTEVDRVPVFGAFLRLFGTFPVRRGESDRDAVRLMREIVRHDEALGVFVEGTRQRSGVPGKAMPGAAMVALRERVPVLPGATRGSESWKPGNLHPVSVAWGKPMDFSGLPANSKGYQEASLEIERELRRLWEWLGEVHAQGRPRGIAVPD
ncbi:MAG: lysophospholipid acyltransferase family protein [Gaiellaceae bacterium]